MKGLLTIIFLLSTSTTFAIECSPDDLQKLDSLKSEVSESVSRLISEVKAYDSTKEKKLDEVIKTLECMEDKIPQMSFACIEGDKKRANALAKIEVKRSWDLKKTYSKTIEFFPMFFSRVSLLKVGTIIHEISHMCGTEDIEYYGGNMDEANFELNGYSLSYIEGESYNAKQSFALHPTKKYEKNADNYRLWAANVFCIPGEDCYNAFNSKKTRMMVNIRNLLIIKKSYPMSEKRFNFERENIRKELHDLHSNEKVLTEIEIEELLKPLY